ncbi:MAG: prepilin-type N-terminal cleavage/methylation domain-containing protein [Acidobacteria bacterium]|nr:prepilin-type N-terminal cleavage/methylation domain-containing protein [Acidobacteriota bacterium]
MDPLKVEARGFTLLESMIALLILTTGLLGLAQLFVLAIHQNSYARQNTMAISAAEDKMEDLKNQYNYELATGGISSDLSVGSHGPVTITISGSSGTNQGSYQYMLNWTVSNPAGKEKEITLTATPVSQNVKENRTVQLTSHLAP